MSRNRAALSSKPIEAFQMEREGKKLTGERVEVAHYSFKSLSEFSIETFAYKENYWNTQICCLFSVSILSFVIKFENCL